MNVFIDLGSHYGNILRRFVNSPLYSPDFELHAFEGNPIISESIFSAYPVGCQVHRVLAGTAAGVTPFYINPDQRNQGASIFQEKTTGNLDKENPVQVETIDFPAWLVENFDERDNIIVKSNIEGAEYPLFTKMIEDGSIRLISRLYLRRHWYKIGMSEADDTLFLSRLKKSSERLRLVADYSFA